MKTLKIKNLISKSKNLPGIFKNKSIFKSNKDYFGFSKLNLRYYSKEVPLKTISESFISGSNINYVEEMYRSWRNDKSSVHKSWDVYFTNVDSGVPAGESVTLPPSIGSVGSKHAGSSFSVESLDSTELSNILKLQLLIRAYQVRGHLLADLDPLKLTKREIPPELKIETYGWTEKDLDLVFPLDKVGQGQMLTALFLNSG